MRLNVLRRGERLRVVIGGFLDARLDEQLAELAERIGATYAEFDCAELEGINSVGARSWSDFLGRLAGRAGFEFLNCPAIYLDYCSLLPTKFFARRIVSMRLPFECADCGEKRECQLTVAKLAASDWRPKLDCERCRGRMLPKVNLPDYRDAVTGDGAD